jgi:hypothetical protein
MIQRRSLNLVGVFFLGSLCLAQEYTGTSTTLTSQGSGFTTVTNPTKELVVFSLIRPANDSKVPDSRPATNPFISHQLDSSIPAPTNFSWSVQGNSRPLTYTIFMAEDSTFDTTDIVAANYPDTSLPVWNLKIATVYYWRISAKDSLDNCWDSPIFVHDC